MSNTTLTTLRMRLKTSVLALALLALPLGVSAAGLGKVTVLSALGQPLRAELDITASREELSSLSAQIATPNAFKQAGIEYTPALVGIRLAVDKRPDGQPFLSMVSDRPFNEPFLDLLVELNWTSGRLVREYTFLLDPPESLQKPAAAMAAPVAVPEVKREAPATVAVQAPVASEKQPDMPVAGPAGVTGVASAEQQKTPRPEMKIVRGADGVQRIVKVEPAQEKLTKEVATRLVKHGDTLNQIASATKPEGVSLDQMLVALFLGNRDAFEGNVNRLKAGKIIAIPDRETAAAVNAEEARTTVRAHAADFNAYRRKLAAAVASAASRKEEEPKRAVSGKIQPKVEDKAPAPVPGKDKLEVSRSEAAPGAAGKPGSGRIAAIEETLVAREKALKEANSRIADLEKNLQDLKKLVELKSQGMADLQKQVKPGQPAATVVEAKKPAIVPATEPVTEKPATKAPDATVQPIQPPAPSPAPKPAPTVKQALPAPTPPQPEPSFIDQSPEIVFGGGAILALLLGYFGYARWRKQRQAGDHAATDAARTREPSDKSASGLGGSQLVDTDNLLAPTDFSSQSSMGASGSNAGVDPVAEADVYMAYGRDVQAEEILLDALKSDPTRHAIHLKLLEIYAARKSKKQFEAIATDLHKQTGGVGSDWEKAARLGQQVDPDNPLYGARTEAAAEFNPDATILIAPAEQGGGAASESLESLKDAEAAQSDAQPPIDIPPVHEDFTESLDFELDLSAAAQEPKPIPSEPAEGTGQVQSQDDLSGSLDIEFDLGTGTPVASEPLPEHVAIPTSPQDETSGALDIDLDLELGTETPEPLATETVLAADSMQQPDTSGEKAGGLDFDFDLGSGKPSEMSVLSQADDGNVIDFDLQLPEPVAKQPAVESIDLSSISLDIGEPMVTSETDEPLVPPMAAQPAATSFDLSSISLDLDGSPAPSAAPEPDEAVTQEVATKFELALAYEEMGDKEGARELLQEVINEGNAAQQAAARSKLAQLDR